jgi:hypothetical protein
MTIKQTLHHLNLRSTRLLPKNLTVFKLLSFTLIIFSAIFFAKTIVAEETTSASQALTDYLTAKNKGVNLESWQSSSFNNSIYNGFTLVYGENAITSIKENENKLSTSSATTYKPGGLMGITTNLVASTFTPAASGVEYIAQSFNNFLGKPVYAQDTGFQGLSNIMSLWKVFRNAVYVLISLAFIVLGIMIMLRIKASPQTVVTLQNSIPKVITTLILVTFSYAIAGLLIDIVNLFQALALSLIFNGIGKNLSDNLFQISWSDWSLTNMINAIKTLFGDNAFNFSHLNSGNFWMILSLTQRLAPNVITTLLGAVIGGVLGSFIAPGAGTLIGGAAGGILFSVIIAIVLIIYLIKLAVNLAKCYVSVILKIITGPLEIFLGVFPNSQVNFGTWITELIANLVTFPVCLLFLVIVNLICDSVSSGLWAPNLVQGPFVWFLPIIIGISAIGMLSRLPALIPEFIFKIKPSPFGKAIGEGLGALPGGGTVKDLRAGIHTDVQQGQKGLYNRIRGGVERNKYYQRAEEIPGKIKKAYTDATKERLPDDHPGT